MILDFFEREHCNPKEQISFAALFFFNIAQR